MKKVFFKISQYLDSLFDKNADLQDFKLIKKRLQHRFFVVNITKPSRKMFVICFIESPLKMKKKNAFYFILKALFIPKIYKFSF